MTSGAWRNAAQCMTAASRICVTKMNFEEPKIGSAYFFSFYLNYRSAILQLIVLLRVGSVFIPYLGTMVTESSHSVCRRYTFWPSTKSSSPLGKSCHVTLVTAEIKSGPNGQHAKPTCDGGRICDES